MTRLRRHAVTALLAVTRCAWRSPVDAPLRQWPAIIGARLAVLAATALLVTVGVASWGIYLYVLYALARAGGEW